MPMRPGEQLVYRVSWIGIPAATVSVSLLADPNGPNLLTGKFWLRTDPFVDMLYRMRDYLRESFTKFLRPVTMYTRQREGGRWNDFKVTFNQRDHVVAMTRRYPRGVERREFTSANPVGPISGSLMALAQPLKVGDSLKFDTFLGLNRYVLDFHVVSRERIDTQVGSFDAFKIVPSVLYVSDGGIKRKARHTTIWVSAGAPRLPLRIQSKVFIGSIRVDLVKIIGPPSAGAVASGG
jgi:hypothetical protein